MTATVILGAQWGDEGKGRVTDYFAESAEFVVRYQGGNNAGHTIIIGEEKFALSLVPSGVMNQNAVPIIGCGAVVDPAVLLDEMEMLRSRGVDPSKLLIDSAAHLIMPYHRALDEVLEARRGDANLGTTKKGIGPAYQDKFERAGLRMQDLLDPGHFRALLKNRVAEKNHVFTSAYGLEPFDAEVIADHYLEMAETLRPYIADTTIVLHNASKAGQNILFEGAQGTLLDINHGTYPFVTSSSPTAGGVTTGTGLGPKAIDEIVGVSKAYITRVGSGIFPTELFDEDGVTMVNLGHEYGVVTGRRRRPGWLDLVSLRYAARINSLTGIFLTKLDILSAFNEIKLANGYMLDGEVITEFPRDQRELARVSPIYETFPGWKSDVTGARHWDDLPSEAQSYIKYIEKAIDTPIRWISVGPERQQLLER